jgi:hypothetical protein
MKFLFFLLFMSHWSLAAAPGQWAAAQAITERHEFYKDDEAMEKPKGSWEHLFSIRFPSRNLRNLKDCVYYRVPGIEKAELRIRTFPDATKCDLKAPALKEIVVTDLKSMIFSANDSEAKLHLRFSKNKSETWTIETPAKQAESGPKLLQSSSDYKSASVLLLSKTLDDSPAQLLKDGEACFKVSELCAPMGESLCQHCANGWYEIPTGCKTGPKFCGTVDCGTRNQPACLRGKKYQRRDAEYECRRDSSFAYCQKGLTLQCEGNMAYCR